MRANEHLVMSECIERGIARGYRRAFKHSDNPVHEHIMQELEQAVMTEICEYFVFDEVSDGA